MLGSNHLLLASCSDVELGWQPQETGPAVPTFLIGPYPNMNRYFFVISSLLHFMFSEMFPHLAPRGGE